MNFKHDIFNPNKEIDITFEELPSLRINITQTVT